MANNKNYSEDNRYFKQINLLEWDLEFRKKTLFLMKILVRMIQKEQDKKLLDKYFKIYNNSEGILDK